MHGFAILFVTQANTPEIRPFDDAIVMLRSTNQSENTTVSTSMSLAVHIDYALLTPLLFAWHIIGNSNGGATGRCT